MTRFEDYYDEIDLAEMVLDEIPSVKDAYAR